MNNRLILIVEDNSDDEALLLRVLKKHNVKNEIVVVRNGAEALDYLFRNGTYEDRGDANPAVVLLDLKLPKIDGIEVLKRVRDDERTKRVPVVILTSSDKQEDKIRSYDLGCNSYVRKPLGFDRFTEAVAQLGLYWLILNEPPLESG